MNNWNIINGVNDLLKILVLKYHANMQKQTSNEHDLFISFARDLGSYKRNTSIFSPFYVVELNICLIIILFLLLLINLKKII